MKLTPRTPLAAISLAALFLIRAFPAYAAADSVTFYENVAPILQANCVSCHQPAGKNIGSLVAPMSLMTYEEVRPWARAIARRVKAREMPPWFADEPTGVFANERGLTDQEIETIVAWVDAGAPGGDTSKTPPPVRFAEAETGGYSLGTPDLIVKMDPYYIGDEAQDVQGTFHVKISEDLLPHDVSVRAWEFRAGTYLAGRDTVHHMCGGVRPPGAATNAADDAEGEGAANLSLGCIAGGAEPTLLPDGFGMELKKGSTVTMNMHYYKRPGPGTGYMNQAEIGFYFAKGPIKYKVQSKSIGTTGFEIPPQKVNYRIGAAETLEKDTLILAYWPHAHLRATSARYVATYPDGRKEVLLNVPRYDQSWQVTYKYRQPKLLPKGTRIDVDMLYDNSVPRGAKRLFNPNLTVRNGPRTQDEMMLGFLSYVELEAGEAPPVVTTQQQQ
jgi:mono/diheme cytochrome c family protein